MIRPLVVAGALALALVPPAVTLAAPTPVVVPAYRGGAVPHPVLHSETRRGAEQNTFKVPEINLRPRSSEPNTETFYSYHWHGWQPTHNYVLFQPPPLYQLGCLGNNGFASPSGTANNSAAFPTNVTIGSLVDDHSKNLFSSTPSHNPGFASSDQAAATANTSGVQLQFQSSPCAPGINF